MVGTRLLPEPPRQSPQPSRTDFGPGGAPSLPAIRQHDAEVASAISVIAGSRAKKKPPKLAAVSAVLREAENNEKIKTLDLRVINPPKLMSVLPALERLNSLQVFKLGPVRVGDGQVHEYLTAVADIVNNNQQLETLSLDMSALVLDGTKDQLAFGGLIEVLRDHSSLLSITLNFQDSTIDDISAMIEALAYRDPPTNLRLNLTNTKEEEFGVDLETIITALRKGKPVLELAFHRDDCSRVVEAFGRTLDEPTSLRSFKLIGDPYESRDDGPWKRTNEVTIAIQELILRLKPTKMEAFSIIHIDLADPVLDSAVDPGVDLIGDLVAMLKDNETLQKLSLIGCFITDDGARRLAEAMMSNMQCLNLRGNYGISADTKNELKNRYDPLVGDPRIVF